jgi:hypothetical protein
MGERRNHFERRYFVTIVETRDGLRVRGGEPMKSFALTAEECRRVIAVIKGGHPEPEEEYYGKSPLFAFEVAKAD